MAAAFNWVGTTYAPPASTDIATIEAALLAQLKSQVVAAFPTAAILVEHFPDDPERYRLVSKVGAILVIYKDDDYGDVLATDSMVQERTLQFEIGIISRSLGWAYASGDATAPGAYQMLETVRQALTGFLIPGCRKIHPLRTRFAAADDQGAEFRYAMTVAVPTLATEVGSADTTPATSKIEILEEGAQTTQPVAALPYTFNSSNQIQLPDQNISSVVVSNGSTIYSPNIDYSLDAVNGIITALGPPGIITAGETVTVAYNRADVVTALASGGGAPTAPTN